MKPAVACTSLRWLVNAVLHLICGTQSITHLSLYFTMPIIILTDLKVSKRCDQPLGPHLRSQHPAEPSFVCILLPAETRCHSVFFVLWACSFASSSNCKEFKPVPILSVYLICLLSLSLSQISEKFVLIGCQLTINQGLCFWPFLLSAWRGRHAHNPFSAFQKQLGMSLLLMFYYVP